MLEHREENIRNAFDIKSEKCFAREDGIKVGPAEGEARGLAKDAQISPGI